MRLKTLGLFGVGILALFICLTLVSAKVVYTDITGAELSTLSFTGNHNSQVTTQFKLENQDENVTNITITSLDENFTLSGVPLILNAGATSDVITLTVNIPQYKSGTYSTTLEGNATMSGTISFDLPVEVIINESKSISVSSPIIPTDSNSTTITIKNEGNTQLSIINLSAIAGGDFDVSFDLNDFSLAPEASKDVLVTMTSDITDLTLGANLVTIIANASDGTSNTGEVSFTKSFCDVDNKGDLGITIEDITVIEGFGDDDDFWYPFDEIEIELEVDPGKYDIDNIDVEWELYTESGDKIMDDTESDFNLDEDDDEKKIIITFKLDKKLSKLEGEDKLIFYARAKGKIDDSSAGLNDNKDTCDWISKEIKIHTSDDFVILSDIKIVGTSFCGSMVQLTADIINIGDDKQKDVSIRIYNSELGVNEVITLEEDIKAFKDKTLSLEFKIPSNLDEKNYYLLLEVYDEDSNIYKNSEDDESKYSLIIPVSGNCEKVADATINATLESGGKAGEEMKIKVSITNTGSETKTFTIEAADYADWAELVSIEPSSFTLDKDKSKEIIITLNVDSDAPEDSIFSVILKSEDGETLTQPISAVIEKGFSLKSIVGDNGYIWGIILLNIILIIIIIVVAIRVARR